MGSDKERVVMVTGASGALGRVMVAAFTGAGLRVAGVARGQLPALPGLTPIAADLSTPEGCGMAVESTLQIAGRLDIVVHTVGGFAGGEPVDGTDPSTWDAMMAQNLRSAFLLFRAVLAPMKAARRGSVLAIGSRAGQDLPAGLAAYAVSKAGLHALVRVVAKEGLEHGITANVLAPGTIDTPANRAAMPGADTGRWVRPETLARQALWLTSADAGGLSGAVLAMDGNG